jgi:hypothetical protein
MINLRASEVMTVIGSIPPQDGAATVRTTAWTPVKPFSRIVAIVQFGSLAGTSFDAKIQQATVVGGTGAKDVTGKAIVQMVGTDDNKQAIIELNAEELDIAGGFDFVQFSITPVGAGVNNLAGLLLGFYPSHLPASDYKVSTLVQNVN